MKNKKGLSDVVTTLIIILLAIVAIAIVWFVVQNLLEKQSTNINYNTKCLGIDIQATKMELVNVVVGIPPAPTTADVQLTLERMPGSTQEEVDGVLITIADNTGNKAETPTDNVFAKRKITLDVTGVTLSGGLTTLTAEVAPYFLDEDDATLKHFCTATAFPSTA